MSDVVRQAYVISDLHLGGVYATAANAQDRGFRICTHSKEVAAFIDALTAKPVDTPKIELIVNGDLVDFLAEQDLGRDGWSAFTYDQDVARQKLDAIIERDRVVFDALGRFVVKGHRLVILLGNHDIELAMPAVRSALAKAIGVSRGADYELVRDGEGYLVGDALVEHGNRYDAFNVVNYERLQRHCQFVSRGQRAFEVCFDPPPGSRMVAEVINPIKKQYKFVDLLKPENGAVVPLLLTLEPGFRKVLGRVALIASKARGAVKVSAGGKPVAQPARVAVSAGMGGFEDDSLMASDISSEVVGAAGGPQTEDAALHALLSEKMGGHAQDVHAAVTEATGTEEFSSDISSVGDMIDRSLGMARLLFSSATESRQTRLDALVSSFRTLQDDQTFDEGVETGAEYMEAATALASHGVRHVVFGHTHMPKKIGLPSGGYYLNSGTWADVMEFPRDLLAGTKDEARTRVAAFVDQIVKGDFSSFALFRPTYVRLDVNAEGSVTPELCRFDPAATTQV